ncbi:MAG: leucyl aminopeptidase [Syntrophotaleaceae bacterium]
MDIRVKSGHALKQKTSCLVMCLPEGKLHPLAKEADQALGGLITGAVKSREFSGKRRQTLLLHTRGLPCERLLLVGLGKTREAEGEVLRSAAATAARFLAERSITDCAFLLPEELFPEPALKENAQTVVEGILLASYRFERYRTDKDQNSTPALMSLLLLVSQKNSLPAAEAGIREAQHLCSGVHLARDLVNEPGNVKSPEYLADQARNLAQEHGLVCTILDKQEMETEGMGALLGVAQGSVREPRLIVLQYRGGTEDAQPIALVGKGVVFDSGGISLKPGEKMDQMKMDMAGAAAVLGTFRAAALLRLPVNLVGVIPAVENMPSGTAIRPGDILTSLSGRTIEVLNTDAEGRLILADALTYVERFQPRVVIDLATLTGACIIALGHHATAVLGNHPGLIRQLMRCGELTGEKLWQLPLWDEYAEQIKSDIADVKNIGGRPAGTITAAAFLHKFAANFRWAHLDIAGTAWEENGGGYRPKGATGVGVRLLVQYLKQCGL